MCQQLAQLHLAVPKGPSSVSSCILWPQTGRLYWFVGLCFLCSCSCYVLQGWPTERAGKQPGSYSISVYFQLQSLERPLRLLNFILLEQFSALLFQNSAYLCICVIDNWHFFWGNFWSLAWGRSNHQGDRKENQPSFFLAVIDS